jgi:hypothetical protein
MNQKIQPVAVSTKPQHRLPERLRTLNYWLATEDVYTSDYVRNWLKRTPPHEAMNVLARIAENASPEPHSVLYSAYRGCLMIFTTSEAVSEKGPAGRKAGVRAALLLAQHNDARCLPPLIRVFETHWLWIGKYQEDIEAALLRFLRDAGDRPEIRRYTGELRRLAERLWRIGGGRRELSARHADLLEAILHSLRHDAEEPDLALLRTLAASRATSPNRSRVCAAAAALLHDTD